MKILRRSFVIIFIILILCMSGCAEKQQGLTIDELISLGEKYLLELNYEQALVQFNKVIEIDPMNVRGYTGAAEAYIGLEQLDEVVAILQKGFERTEDDEIRNMLDEPIEHESMIVSSDYPITVTGRIDSISVLFSDKYKEYEETYENNESNTFLSGGTSILFDNPIIVTIDDESVMLNGAILATMEVIDFIGKDVSITGYFSKQDIKFQQEITGPHSLAELLNNPDESGYVYYFNPVGCYLLVINEIKELQ